MDTIGFLGQAILPKWGDTSITTDGLPLRTHYLMSRDSRSRILKKVASYAPGVWKVCPDIKKL
ncbi:MAG: hypothetical protein WBA22_15830 [Candidatus Methanofastidiosia archaeon]